MQKGSTKQITMNYSNFMTYGFMPTEEEIYVETNAVSIDESCVENSAVTGIETQAGAATYREAYAECLAWVELAQIPSTGIGGAMIERVAMFTPDNPQNNCLLIGGEVVEFFLELSTKVDLKSPIICADFRDRNSNLIFSLNIIYNCKKNCIICTIYS